jgi:hypothetical protein
MMLAVYSFLITIASVQILTVFRGSCGKSVQFRLLDNALCWVGVSSSTQGIY